MLGVGERVLSVDVRVSGGGSRGSIKGRQRKDKWRGKNGYMVHEYFRVLKEEC